jgi:hypothetical protein
MVLSAIRNATMQSPATIRDIIGYVDMIERIILTREEIESEIRRLVAQHWVSDLAPGKYVPYTPVVKKKFSKMKRLP